MLINIHKQTSKLGLLQFQVSFIQFPEKLQKITGLLCLNSQFVRWENSKRLLYGSLVCLSMDNFETFLFATVSDRDPKELKTGQVQLSFSRNSRAQLATTQASHSFLMVETTAYFEAYRYVLEGLQEQEEDDLPFQRYTV